jgi:plastocyanin
MKSLTYAAGAFLAAGISVGLGISTGASQPVPTPSTTVPVTKTSAPLQTAPAEAPKVSIDNFKFSPAELTVPVGTTVTWVNHDDVPHTATSKNDPPAFDSKALDTDQSFSFTFTKPGTYGYYCKVHTHMTARIIVK